MRKAYKFKIQNQSNTLKLGNMIDDMWDIHVHIRDVNAAINIKRAGLVA